MVGSDVGGGVFIRGVGEERKDELRRGVYYC